MNAEQLAGFFEHTIPTFNLQPPVEKMHKAAQDNQHQGAFFVRHPTRTFNLQPSNLQPKAFVPHIVPQTTNRERSQITSNYPQKSPPNEIKTMQSYEIRKRKKFKYFYSKITAHRITLCVVPRLPFAIVRGPSSIVNSQPSIFNPCPEPAEGFKPSTESIRSSNF